MPATSERSRRLRADAERNRSLLLQAGKTLVAEHGDDFPLSAVAKVAGVGAGTLHRHFPTKPALLLAIYVKDSEETSEWAQTLKSEMDADSALATWIAAMASFACGRPGVAEAFRAVANDQYTAGAYKGVLDALTDLLASSSDNIRKDIAAEDIVMLFGGIWDLPDTPERPRRIRAAVDLILRGLRST